MDDGGLYHKKRIASTLKSYRAEGVTGAKDAKVSARG